MNKILTFSFILIISIFLTACEDTTTTNDSDYTTSDNSSSNNMLSNDQQSSDLANGDLQDGDPLAASGGNGDLDEAMSLLLGDDSGTDGSIGDGARFVELGKVNANINGSYYNYISAIDVKHNAILFSAYSYNPTEALYYVQIVGYDIQDDQLNPNAGYILIKYSTPDLEVRGVETLLYPTSGLLQLSESRTFDGKLIVSGSLSQASITTEDNVTVEGSASFTSINALNLNALQ